MYYQKLGRKVALSLGMVAGMAMSPVQAQNVDFSGRTITMITPTQAGGGGDVLARGIAARLQEELPGRPTILVENRPGGGAVTGANVFQANAKPDGGTIFLALSAHLLYHAFQEGQPQIQYDPAGWIALMGGGSGYVISGSKIGGITDLDSLMAQDRVVWGVTSTLGIGLMYLLGLDVMGVNIHPVFNVDGSDATLALQRGEFKLDSETIPAHMRTTQPLVEKGEVFPLFTVGQPGPDGTIVRDPGLAHIPNFPEAYEMVHGTPPEGEKWEIWNKLFGAMVANAYSVVLPAGTPDDIVATYDAAIKRALDKPNDPEIAKLLGAGQKAFGDTARAAYDKAIADLTPDLVDWVRNWLKDRFNVVV